MSVSAQSRWCRDTRRNVESEDKIVVRGKLKHFNVYLGWKWWWKIHNSGLLIMPPANVGIFLEKLWPQSCQSMDALLWTTYCRHRHKFIQNIQILISRNKSPGPVPLCSSVLSRISLCVISQTKSDGDWWLVDYSEDPIRVSAFVMIIYNEYL